MPQRTTVAELPFSLHEFASDISRLVYPARVEYVNRLLAGEKDNLIIKEIQPKYGINKRQANAIRCEAKGKDSGNSDRSYKWKIQRSGIDKSVKYDRVTKCAFLSHFL